MIGVDKFRPLEEIVAKYLSRFPREAHFRACCSLAMLFRATAALEAGKRRPRGITKPRPISPELQELVGVKEIPRTQGVEADLGVHQGEQSPDPSEEFCQEKKLLYKLI